MKIEKITPQIAALYLGQKCEWYWVSGSETGKGATRIIDPTCIGLMDENSITGRIKITPHLRRLESMTEDEAREVCESFYGKPVREKVGWSHLGFLLNPVEGVPGPVIGSLIGSPPVWLYLLSRGFDLFGLLDTGLAKEIVAQ